MPYAVALRLDPATAMPVEAMRRALAASAPGGEADREAYPPHVTLTLFLNDVAESALRASLARVVQNWTAEPITLAGWGVFPGDPATIWAAPVVTAGLLARHAGLHATLPADFICHPHYRPGSWLPHVTLGQGDRASPARALAVLAPLWEGPITGKADRIDLVRFHPVEIVWSEILHASGSSPA